MSDTSPEIVVQDVHGAKVFMVQGKKNMVFQNGLEAAAGRLLQSSEVVSTTCGGSHVLVADEFGDAFACDELN